MVAQNQANDMDSKGYFIEINIIFLQLNQNVTIRASLEQYTFSMNVITYLLNNFTLILCGANENFLDGFR